MADTSIKLSGTYDSIEAYRILEEMRDMSEDYEDIKTEAEAAASAATAAVATANAAVTNATTAANNASTYAGNANTSASDAAGYAANASTSATNAAASETNASNSATAAAGSATAAADSADDAEAAAELVKKDLPLPIGFEYFSMNPNIPQGSLPLIGGVYSRETYADLWAWVQTQSGYLKTEAEWQTLSTANNGNVPFYSSGDGSTTFRVPSLHCWIKGSDGSAQLVGSYLQAGLPNITGRFMLTTGKDGGKQYALYPYDTTGVFFKSTVSQYVSNVAASERTLADSSVEIDASRSSSVYGNANTVVPESIVGMWLVKAYGVIVDTGTIDEQAYIDDRFNASKQYTDDEVNDAVTTLNTNISAINTRLGTILTASGNNTAVSTLATLCSITTHPAGVFLITSFMDLSYSGTGIYINHIQTANHESVATRNTANSGGGNCAVLLTALDENEVVDLQGYQDQSGTMSGYLRMVQLA